MKSTGYNNNNLRINMIYRGSENHKDILIIRLVVVVVVVVVVVARTHHPWSSNSWPGRPRKVAASFGFVHNDSAVKGVGLLGQLNR